MQRTPTELKKIKGTFRKDRVPTTEIHPTIAVGLVAPPELNEWAVKLWNSITDEYSKIGLITNVDLGALYALANEFGTYCEADDIIKAKGLEVEEEIFDKKGIMIGTRIVSNPMIHVRNAAFKNFNLMCGKFGITPADRTRLAAPVKSSDPFDEFDE